MSQDDITVIVDVEDIDVTVEKIVDVDISISDNTNIQELTIESAKIDFEVKESNIDMVLEPYVDVIVVAAGNLGEPGLPGPPGAGASTYIYTQGSPSSIWEITHNLGWYPSVTVVDTGGTVVEPDIYYNTNNQVTLTFGSPTTGKAYLNPGIA